MILTSSTEIYDIWSLIMLILQFGFSTWERYNSPNIQSDNCKNILLPPSRNNVINIVKIH